MDGNDCIWSRQSSYVEDDGAASASTCPRAGLVSTAAGGEFRPPLSPVLGGMRLSTVRAARRASAYHVTGGNPVVRALETAPTRRRPMAVQHEREEWAAARGFVPPVRGRSSAGVAAQGGYWDGNDEAPPTPPAIDTPLIATPPS